MNTFLTRTQLKDNAKEKLTGHYGFLIGAMLFISIASSIISALFTSSISTETTAGYIVYQTISFIISAITGIFSVGSSLLYLKFACDAPVTFSDVFHGFIHSPNRSLLISVAVSAAYLFSIPADLFSTWVYNRTGSLYEYILSLFFATTVAVIIETFILLNLMPCFYLMLDFPNKSAAEILKLSFRIMKGHRIRLLLLELSFLPLILLGALSVIGLLWVIPYMQMTYAFFYLDIIKTEQKI